jgi:hypothetical protein
MFVYEWYERQWQKSNLVPFDSQSLEEWFLKRRSLEIVREAKEVA